MVCDKTISMVVSDDTIQTRTLSSFSKKLGRSSAKAG